MLEISQAEKDSIAKQILDLVEIPYITSDIIGTTYALDEHKIAGYDIQVFRDMLQDNVLGQFYKDLILSWILNCDPVCNRDWGFDSSDEPIPYRLVNSFGTDKLPMYRYGLLSAVPDNMVLVVKDKAYLRELREVYIAFSDKLDELNKLYINLVAQYGMSISSICSQIDMKLKDMSILI